VSARWLLKTEPECYAFDRLLAEKRTVWDGVTNALALKHIRAMKKGDLAVIYHTGDERAAVGTAKVVSDPYPDPSMDDERLAVVDVAAPKRWKRAVPLAAIKAHPALSGWDLVRIPRLSVVPVGAGEWKALLALAGEKR